MDIVSILTDLPVAGGADAAAPAPILGLDAQPPFADLLLAPDAAGPPVDPAFAAVLPANGNSLPVPRQAVAAETAEALPPATSGDAEDDGGADAEPMWLPLSLDLPMVAARSLTPMAAPVTAPAPSDAGVTAEAQDAPSHAARDENDNIAPLPSHGAAVAARVAVPAGAIMTPDPVPVAVPETVVSPASPDPVRHSNAAMAMPGAVPTAPVPAGDAASLTAPAVTTSMLVSLPVMPAMTPVGVTDRSLPDSLSASQLPVPAASAQSAAPVAVLAAVPPSPTASPVMFTTAMPDGLSPRPAVLAAADRPIAGGRDGAILAQSAVTGAGPSANGSSATVVPPFAPIPAIMPDGLSPRLVATTAANPPATDARDDAAQAVAAPSSVERGAAQPVLPDGPQAPTPALVAAAPVGIAAPALVEAARAPAPQTPVLDTGRADWLDTLVDRIEEARATGPVRVTHMKLLPDALGALDVRIRIEGERVHVTFTTDSPDARAIIADAAPKLAEMAEARGVRLGQTQVDLGAGAGGGQQRAAGGRDAELPAALSARRDQADAEPETATARPRATRDRLA